MEKTAEAIGKEEFNDVWTRVSGGETLETDAAPETKASALTTLSKTLGSLNGLVSNVLGNTGVSSATSDNTSDTQRGAAAAKSRAQLVTEAESGRLLEIMNATAQTKRECTLLTSQNSGEIRKASRAMEQVSGNIINDLNSQYYMLTGLRYCPGSVITQRASASERLSVIADTESAVCDVCLEAADNTAIASLQGAYIRTAERSRRIELAAEQLLRSLNY